MFTLLIITFVVAMVFGTKRPFICDKSRCDFLKAWLPLMIIFHHHSQIMPYPGVFSNDFEWLGLTVVWMFFAISGYGLEFKRERGELYKKGILKRLSGLIVPTVMPILVYVAVVWALGMDLSASLQDNLKRNYYFLPYSWFVVSLGLQYVFFYICGRIKDSVKFDLMFTLLTILSMILFRLMDVPPYIYISNFGFFAGALYKQYEQRLLTHVSGKRLAVCAACLIVPFVWVQFKFPLSQIILNGIWLIAMLIMFSYIQIKLSKIDLLLKNVSYEIYLCQGIGFVIISQFSLPRPLAVLSVIIISVACAYLCKGATVLFNKLHHKKAAQIDG